MSFNFNDPAGIQALLDELRSSAAWQDLADASAPTSVNLSESPSAQSPSVAALLSQLQADSHPSPAANDKESAQESTTLHLSGDIPKKDIRLLSIDESMPLLLRLAQEPSFVSEVQKIKQDQDSLERQLWEERRSIHQKHEEKAKTAKVKASMIGISISKHETETLVAAHTKELHKFDNDRALPAWDNLAARQQARLQQLKVPTMYVTSDASTRELQQRILQVLTSIIGPPIK